MNNLDKLSTSTREACPTHGHDLVPLHTVENGVRRVVGLTCPEPYCEHVRMLTRDEAERFATSRRFRGVDRRASAAVSG